ncbi:MAG TPA: hypothetical protein VJR89_13740, partial [Polyangiales bacterium]|nr:hypothetical protein [Polyangiales bacterium]
MSAEPRRWLDSEIPAELRDALASADLDRAPDAQLARLSAKLEQAIGPGWTRAAGNTESSALGAPAAASGGLHWASALAVAGVLLAGLGAVWYGTRPSQPQRTPAALTPAKTIAAPVAPIAAAAATPTLQPSLPEAAPKLAAAPIVKRSAARPAAQSGGLIE